MNTSRFNPFEKFVTAYARGQYKYALRIWDNYHKQFSEDQTIVANTIVKLIDRPQFLVLS